MSENGTENRESSRSKLIENAIRKHANLIFRTAYQSLGNYHDAQDVLGEVSLALVRFKAPLEDNSYLRNWLVRVTLNKCRDLKKSAWRRRTEPITEDIPVEAPNALGVIDELNAPQELIDSAVKRALEAEQSGKVLKVKHNIKKYTAVGAVAAGLALIITLSTVFYPQNNSKKEINSRNSFALIAYAAEASSDEAKLLSKDAVITIGTCNIETDGISADENLNTYFVTNYWKFPIVCDGENVEAVRYSVENAVFQIPSAIDRKGKIPYYDLYTANEKIIDEYMDSEKNSAVVGSFDDSEIVAYSVKADRQPELKNYPVYMQSSLSTKDVNISEELKQKLKGLLTGDTDNESNMSAIREIYRAMLERIRLTAKIKYKDGSFDIRRVALVLQGISEDGLVIGAKLI